MSARLPLGCSWVRWAAWLALASGCQQLPAASEFDAAVGDAGFTRDAGNVADAGPDAGAPQHWVVENPRGHIGALTSLSVASPGSVWFGGQGLASWSDGGLATRSDDSVFDLWASADVLWAVKAEGVARWADGGWGISLPTNAVTKLWGSSSTDVWAVGKGRWHFDGTKWSDTDVDGGGWDLIWGAAADDVWALGAATGFAHYDGSGWKTMSVTTPNGWVPLAMAGSGPRDVWSGGSSSLLHYDGTWKEVTPPEASPVASLWSPLPNQVWGCWSSGALWRFDGARWVGPLLPSRKCVGGVAGSGPNDVWALFDSGAISHFDGVEWHDLSGETATLNGVWGSAGKLWAVGEGRTVLSSSGDGRWQKNPVDAGTSRYQHTLLGVWGANDHDAWAVGWRGTYHYDGSAWSLVYGEDRALGAAWGSAADDVWAVGWVGGNVGVVDHFDGTSWSEVVRAGMPLTSIWGGARNDVWAAGLGTLMHYDGQTWSAVDAGVVAPSRLSGCAPDDVWGLTPDGQVVRFDGTSWSVVSGPDGGVNSATAAVLCSRQHGLWVVDGADALHRDGQRWSRTRLPLPARDFMGAPQLAEADGDLWLVGNQGVILHRLH